MRRLFQIAGNTQAVFSSILLFGLLAITARNALDPDLWWHLRTGQWIVENGHIPHTDPFSFTRAGHAWVAHEWLSEVVFYELWKHGGTTALMVFSAIVTTAGLMLLYRRCIVPETKRHWGVAATACGALACAPSWGVRPQMFTFVFASLFLSIVDRGEQRPRLLLWIAPLFLLWLNLHAGFALGPALLFAYAFGLLLETALGNTAWEQARPILLRVALLLIVCVALVPFNPSGAQLYHYPFDTLRSAGMRSLIGEWHSPDFHEWLYRPFLLLWLSLLAVLAGGLARPKARVMIPLLLTAFAALDAVRHIPIFILLAMPVLAGAVSSADAFGRKSSQLPPAFGISPHRASHGFPLRPLINGVLVLLMAVFAAARWSDLARHQHLHQVSQFPDRAVAFLRDAHYPPRLFVYYDWGGYALWKLYPNYRVFADGRADLYQGSDLRGNGPQGDDLLRQFKTALQLQTGWRQVLDTWKVDEVLVPPSCALAQALELEPDWHTAFLDSQAILLLRDRPAVEYAAIALHIPRPGLRK